MSIKHEFAFNELNKSKAHEIVEIINSLAPGTVNRTCAWGPSDPVVRVGAVCDSQAQMVIFLANLKTAVQSGRLKNPDIDISRPYLSNMHSKARCQTGADRRIELSQKFEYKYQRQLDNNTNHITTRFSTEKDSFIAPFFTIPSNFKDGEIHTIHIQGNRGKFVECFIDQNTQGTGDISSINDEKAHTASFWAGERGLG